MQSRLTSLASLLATFPDLHPAQLAHVMNADTRVRAMNAYTPGNPAGMAGNGFTVDIYEQIRATAYDVKYPDIRWTQFIPAGAIDTSINPGARVASARVRDWRGKGAFRSAYGKDIPTVDVSMGKVSVPLEAAAISAHVDREELRQVAFGFEGMNLLTEKGAAMRRAHDLHREEVFFFGFAGLGMNGYLASSGVPVTTAGTKAATGTTWAVATPAEIVKDVTDAFVAVITGTREVFKPNRVVLPTTQFMRASMLNMGVAPGTLTGESVLTYLQRTLTALNGGQQIEIVSLPYLQGAGAGGTDRMIVESVSNDTFYLPDSLPFNMLPPQDILMTTSLYAEYKFGGLLRPFPTSAVYVDGI